MSRSNRQASHLDSRQQQGKGKGKGNDKGYEYVRPARLTTSYQEFPSRSSKLLVCSHPTTHNIEKRLLKSTSPIPDGIGF
jgi:hypothetical protein